MRRSILVVDVGGTSVKVMGTGGFSRAQFASGREMTPKDMVAGVLEVTRGRAFDSIALGYPGPVLNGRPAKEPKNLAPGWTRFSFERAFGRPVRIVNDAAMQALGAYRGRPLLFLGLGTGLGAALAVGGTLVPLEIAHLPYRDGGTYEDFVGARGRQRLGDAAWTRHVLEVVALLRAAFVVEEVVLGGGAVPGLLERPPRVRRADPAFAFVGGLRLFGVEPTARERATSATPRRGSSGSRAPSRADGGRARREPR